MTEDGGPDATDAVGVLPNGMDIILGVIESEDVLLTTYRLIDGVDSFNYLYATGLQESYEPSDPTATLNAHITGTNNILDRVFNGVEDPYPTVGTKAQKVIWHCLYRLDYNSTTKVLSREPI